MTPVRLVEGILPIGIAAMTTPRSLRDMLPGPVTPRYLAMGLVVAAGAFAYQA